MSVSRIDVKRASGISAVARRIGQRLGSRLGLVLLLSCLGAQAEDLAGTKLSNAPGGSDAEEADPAAPPVSEGSPTGGKPAGGAVSGAAAAPTEEQLKQARAEAGQRFQRGLGFYGDGDYALALIEFDRAYQLVPDYRVLYNIGQVSIQLGRFARARTALEQYQREGGDNLPRDRIEGVKRDLSMLADRTAFLTLAVSEAEAEVLVDDRSFGFAPLAEPLLLDAGEHRLVVRKRGYVQFSQRVTLAGAESATVDVRLAPVAEEKSVVIVQRPESVVDQKEPDTASKGPVEADKKGGPSPALVGWITTGALAAGAATTWAIGLSAKSHYDELQNTPDVDQNELARAESQAKTLLITADILGAAAVVTGGVSLYFTLKKPAKGPVARLSPPFAAAPGRAGGTPNEARAELVLQLNRVALMGSF